MCVTPKPLSVVRANNKIKKVDAILPSKHRAMKKNFETEMRVNNRKLPLNHFVQETLANTIVGFLKTLKELDEPPKNVEINIKKLAKPMDVDAHTYP